MPNFSNYGESGVLEHLFRQATLAKPLISIALTATVPTETDTGASIDEVPHDFGYARQIATGNTVWSAPAQDGGGSGFISNNSTITFGPNVGTNWGWVSGVAIVDATGDGGGNLIMYGQLVTPKLVSTSDTLSFASGSLVIRLS